MSKLTEGLKKSVQNLTKADRAVYPSRGPNTAAAGESPKAAGIVADHAYANTSGKAVQTSTVKTPKADSSQKEADLHGRLPANRFYGSKSQKEATDRLFEATGHDPKGNPIPNHPSSMFSPQQLAEIVDDYFHHSLTSGRGELRPTRSSEITDEDKMAKLTDKASSKKQSDKISVGKPKNEAKILEQADKILSRQSPIPRDEKEGGYLLGSPEEQAATIERLKSLETIMGQRVKSSPFGKLPGIMSALSRVSNRNFYPTKDELSSFGETVFPHSALIPALKAKAARGEPLSEDESFYLELAPRYGRSGKETQAAISPRTLDIKRTLATLQSRISPNIPGEGTLPNPWKTGELGFLEGLTEATRSGKPRQAIEGALRTANKQDVSPEQAGRLAERVAMGTSSGSHQESGGNKLSSAVGQAVSSATKDTSTDRMANKISRDFTKKIFLGMNPGRSDASEQEIADTHNAMGAMYDVVANDPRNSNKDESELAQLAAEKWIKERPLVAVRRHEMGNIDQKNYASAVYNFFRGKGAGVSPGTANLGDIKGSRERQIIQDALNTGKPKTAGEIKAEEIKGQEALSQAANAVARKAAIRNKNPEIKERTGTVTRLSTQSASDAYNPDQIPETAASNWNPNNPRNLKEDKTPGEQYQEQARAERDELSDITREIERTQKVLGITLSANSPLLRKLAEKRKALEQRETERIEDYTPFVGKSIMDNDLNKSITKKLKSLVPAMGMACGIGGCGSKVEQSGNYCKTSVEGHGDPRTQCYEKGKEVSDSWRKPPPQPNTQATPVPTATPAPHKIEKGISNWAKAAKNIDRIADAHNRREWLYEVTSEKGDYKPNYLDRLSESKVKDGDMEKVEKGLNDFTDEEKKNSAIDSRLFDKTPEGKMNPRLSSILASRINSKNLKRDYESSAEASNQRITDINRKFGKKNHPKGTGAPNWQNKDNNKTPVKPPVGLDRLKYGPMKESEVLKRMEQEASDPKQPSNVVSLKDYKDGLKKSIEKHGKKPVYLTD